jgi:type I restriction enzyme M protein
LTNESSVEQFFVIRLLADLGYADSFIKTKDVLPWKDIGRGRKKEKYRPDYMLYINDKPKIVIDAKSTIERVSDYFYQVSGYSLATNQEYEDENPVEYCILTNGLITELYRWDKKAAILVLSFDDFVDGNAKYEQFKTIVSYKAIEDAIKAKVKEDTFQFEKVDPHELIGIFKACHNIIRRKEGKSPSKAFYEFVKLTFIKLNEDRKLRKDPDIVKMITTQHVIPKEKAIFSLNWIKSEEKTDENPVDSILFKNLRDQLEVEIEKHRKKRIFDPDENLRLKPSTIKKVVKLLEHRDLFGVDEDLNGRLFESFLSATMRGKDLGQFFTPRSVVKFMTKLADLQVAKGDSEKYQTDNVLDGFCGSGGFLIEAMTELQRRTEAKQNLTNAERDTILAKLREDSLYGIDMGEAELPIARIARINMYLHQDGGSRIYQTDFLDKKVKIESGLPRELIKDIQEFKDKLTKENVRFKVVLTNPPFAMKYESSDEDDAEIMKQYNIAFITEKDEKETAKLRKALRSSIMCLERYHDLLERNGKFLTVMDESILNTDTQQYVRQYIKSNFIIKAVISLPRNTFVNAESAVKTSVLYLRKKGTGDEGQSNVFMAISNNVGHNDAGKPTPSLSDLDTILEQYDIFEKNGHVNYERGDTLCFAVSDLSNRTDRIDAHYFDPRYAKTLNEIKEIATRKGMQSGKLGSLLLQEDEKPKITGGATPLGATYVTDDIGIKFLRVQNIGANYLSLDDAVYIPRIFHDGDLKRSQLKPNDVLLTITGTYGVSAVVPANFGEANINQHVVKMEVDNAKIDSHYLALYLNTKLARRQFDRNVTGGTRLALDYPSIAELEVLYPSDLNKQYEIAKKVLAKVSEAKAKLEEYNELSDEVNKISLSEIEG